jgi:hypothetical protein
MENIIFLVKKFLTAFFIFVLSIYFLTSAGRTPYDYFTRLSSAFLTGKYYLSQNPVWLNELINIGPGKYTFVNPPIPAIIAIPFVWIFGNAFQQQYLAHLVGALSIIVVWTIAQKIKRDIKLSIWSSLLLGLGSIFWFLSATGSVWYLGQVTAVFFILLAINESLGRKRPFLIASFLACAFFSRLQLILSLPFFIYLTFRDSVSVKKIVSFSIPIALFFAAYFIYNFLRFGNPLQNGYTLIAGILNEPWFNKGQFSIQYIPNHLYLLFLKLPIFLKSFPYIQPSWAGMAIWITTPAFIYALKANIKDRVNIASWITILLVGLVNFSYGSTGFTQFGYRYAVDFYPFLTLLTIKGAAKTGIKWHHWVLLILSIAVNLWGVLWINKFGWVSF